MKAKALAPKFRVLGVWAAGLLMAIGCARPAQASSDCGVQLSASGVLINWNQNFNFQAVTITVSKTASAACHVMLGFSRGTASDYNRRMQGSGGTLSYQLFKDSSLTQILKDVPDITSSNDAILFDLSGGSAQSTTVTYYVQIPLASATQPTYKQAGTYADTFTIHAYSQKAGSSADALSLSQGGIDASASVVVTTSIPKILEISLLPPGGGFDASQTSRSLDFGVFDGSSVSRALDLRIRSNAGYAIFLSSANNGTLVRAGGGQGAGIGYTLSVNSTPQSLSGSAVNPVRVASGSGQTSTQGNASSLGFAAAASSQNYLAGQYQDVIMVTAVTTE